ncbi:MULTISPECIES: CinA family protein [Porphyromonas]|uniref:CinA family protein n=1 Tax=Porphyromonas TaxID=836 RepID=UPI00068FCD2E|nr:MULTISPECIES: CinA family protein [Porphyromonas]
MNTLKQVQEIAQLLLERGCTLRVAESCTGGNISHRLTETDGSSLWFGGGMVTYTPETKREWLLSEWREEWSSDLVREDVAVAMAQSLWERGSSSSSLITLSTTGVAGDSPYCGHLPGEMWVAAVVCGEIHTLKVTLPPQESRQERIQALTEAALSFLLSLLERK